MVISVIFFSAVLSTFYNYKLQKEDFPYNDHSLSLLFFCLFGTLFGVITSSVSLKNIAEAEFVDHVHYGSYVTEYKYEFAFAVKKNIVINSKELIDHLNETKTDPNSRDIRGVQNILLSRIAEDDYNWMIIPADNVDAMRVRIEELEAVLAHHNSQDTAPDSEVPKE
jgi:hypothetical protein